MVETISPAVCGTRRRTALALTLFAAGSIGVAAAVGLLLGLLGSAALVPVAIALALAGVLRESGVLRLPVPQSRRQVPERWHHELPLPVWSLGYGAGLGVGVLTYQPVATFLVVAVAAAASGPTAAVLALSAFGIGRVAGASLPTGLHRSDGDALPPDAPRQRPRAGRARAGPVRRAGRARRRSPSAPAASSTRPSPTTARSPTPSAPTTARPPSSCVPTPAPPMTIPGGSRAVDARRLPRLPRARPASPSCKWRTVRTGHAPGRRLVEAGHQLAVPGRHPRAGQRASGSSASTCAPASAGSST